MRRSLHAVLAAIKASSAAVFDAPARAVSTSLGDSRSRSCGPGSFLSFQHTAPGADMCTWAAGATTTGGSVIVTRQDDAGTSVAWLRCPDGAALVDAQFYKDEQLAVLVSAPEGASRLEIVDCSQLTFRLLDDDEPLNGANTCPCAHAPQAGADHARYRHPPRARGPGCWGQCTFREDHYPAAKHRRSGTPCCESNERVGLRDGGPQLHR